MRRILVILIVIAFSCTGTKNVKYYYFTFLEESPKRIIVNGDVKDGLEDGKWSLYFDENEISSEGRFTNGLKVDIWKYYFGKKGNEKLIWKVYANKDKQLKVNCPKSWEIIEKPDMLFQATFPTKSTNKKNKYFVILAHNRDSLGLSPLEYKELSFNEINNHCEIEKHDDFLINNGDELFYYTTYTVVRDGEQMVIYNLITELNHQIIDFSYSSLNEDLDIKNIIFFDIIRGCFLNEKRVLNPFINTTITPLKDEYENY